MTDAFAPKQSLGQNFLNDPNTIRNIVQALTAQPSDPVVEIGPGLGALTAPLQAAYPSLLALEIDARAVAYLATHLPEVEVRHQDVLTVDWPALAAERGGALSILGNLPYNITSQILFGLFEAPPGTIREAVVVMQREVAERLVAVPRTKAYGILSVVTQLHTAPTLLFKVSPNVFYPRPDVTSAVVHLDFSGGVLRTHPASDRALLHEVIRTAFNQRRKTLRNSLAIWAKDPAVGLPNTVERQRAEELTPAAFIDLAEHIGARTV
ncbi:MAG: 16S rRNA (adenine(1518)-N(6)/adenine(1519)-N(6))-dimethyltransferase RsmA [Bacteroidota bacterium]